MCDITVLRINGMHTYVLCFLEISKVVVLGYKYEFSEMNSIGSFFTVYVLVIFHICYEICIKYI